MPCAGSNKQVSLILALIDTHTQNNGFHITGTVAIRFVSKKKNTRWNWTWIWDSNLHHYQDSYNYVICDKVHLKAGWHDTILLGLQLMGWRALYAVSLRYWLLTFHSKPPRRHRYSHIAYNWLNEPCNYYKLAIKQLSMVLIGTRCL